MRALLTLLISVVSFVVIAILAVPFLVSSSWIRDEVTAVVKERTGRDLVIAGDTSLTVFPEVALTVGRASLSNPAGREGTFANMEELDLGLELLPLISGRVEVSRFILTRPVFALEIDREGRPNWTFTGSNESESEEDAPTVAGAPAPGGSGPLAGIEGIRVGDVRLIEGTISLEDQRTGRSYEVREINATVDMPSMDAPMTLAGDLAWRGEKLAFNLEVAEPRALTTGTPTGTSLTLQSEQLQSSFSGNLAIKEGLDAYADLQLSSPSIKTLIRLFGASPPRIAGLGPISVSGRVKTTAEEVSLSNAQLAMDDMNAEGGFLVSFAGAKPLVQATLATDSIDMNRYLEPAPTTNGSSGESSEGGGPASTIEQDWSAEPIDVSALRVVDADLRLSTGRLLFKDLTAGQSALAVTLREGVLTVDLSELQLYEGKAVGKLTVNGSGDLPAIAASFQVDDVAAAQLLSDGAGIGWLEGRGQISGALASRGLTERRLIAALNGEVSTRFTDGAVRGFNVAQMLRGLQAGNVMDWSREPSLKTDFSEFTAKFTIAKGIAQANDIQMLGPLVRLSGAGVANLPRRTVDFRVRPKLVASTEGQGGEVDLAGLELPVVIRGPWASPQIAPDVEAVLRDPKATAESVERIGRSIEQLGKNTDLKGAAEALTKDGGKGLMNMILGRDSNKEAAQPGGQGGGEPQPPAPISEDVFKKLMGR